ncbi:SDR family NAD(P)-dependent oxidoreductase [Thalassorhabdomicrobium marinisediminis]|uniref:C factor, cell signaling protein n=1 Tax=Thalassorhabdomicrobium marinisediminis TaxID=2170577 RepID=A0A2T7FST0_9RHOB|nr:SDR family NAD(P)-dependent oxidoreductase [Thalassorhabdomicrobium marinisediminis]PVA05230.1 C factor, cell signaling protein [Thalassorhabdomicrobium marinisediminis]
MKNALVIGASGGIGAALVAELQGRGFAVTGLSRSADGLEVTDKASVERVLGRLSGPFEVVLIAVGTLAVGATPEKSLAALEPQRMLDVYAVNAVGPALVLAEVARLLPREGRAHVGVLSARVGSIGDNRIGGWHSYRASKAALNQIVRGAAIEIGRKARDAVVVSLHPGTVQTGFTADYGSYRKVTAQVAARNLCDVLLRLEPSQSGQFFDYAGMRVDW